MSGKARPTPACYCYAYSYRKDAFRRAYDSTASASISLLIHCSDALEKNSIKGRSGL